MNEISNLMNETKNGSIEVSCPLIKANESDQMIETIIK